MRIEKKHIIFSSIAIVSAFSFYYFKYCYNSPSNVNFRRLKNKYTPECDENKESALEIPQKIDERFKMKISTGIWEEKLQICTITKRVGNLFRGVGWINEQKQLVLNAEETLWLLEQNALQLTNLPPNRLSQIQYLYQQINYQLYRVYDFFRTRDYIVQYRTGSDNNCTKPFTNLYILDEVPFPSFWLWPKDLAGKIPIQGGSIKIPPESIVFFLEENPTLLTDLTVIRHSVHSDIAIQAVSMKQGNICSMNIQEVIL